MSSLSLANSCAFDTQTDTSGAWQESFGTSDFFYIVGLREFFQVTGKSKPEDIAGLLDISQDQSALPFDVSWLDVYPGNDHHKQPKYDQAEWNLDQLGLNVRRKTAKGQAISFAKAMLVLRKMEQLSRRSTPAAAILSKVQVAFANCYVPGFNAILADAKPETVSAIRLAVSPSNFELMSIDMGYGFPVTYATALKIVSCLDNAGPELIATYNFRGEITKTVRENGFDGYGNRLEARKTKRVARGEKLKLDPSALRLDADG